MLDDTETNATNETNFRRTAAELNALASKFWPPELTELAAEVSVVPLLLETQDQFLSILNISVPDIENIYKIINLSTLRPNLFLKHLSVLADFGGEKLMRLNREFKSLFPENKLRYFVNGNLHEYTFSELPIKSNLNNDKLGISKSKIFDNFEFDNLLKDVSMILIFGSECENPEVSNLCSTCEIGNYLGRPDELEKFVKQRYIIVSRITNGAKANDLGQIAQDFVKTYIKENLLIENKIVVKNGSLPGVTQTSDDRDSSFDVVVSNGVKYVGIEVSFQVTTNSTIERKSGQARTRYDQAESKGHKIAYVIDGAGNFQRNSALSTICEYSHCTVAFSREELHVLCKFLIGVFKN
ncbi:hypothetical protein [Methanosarcina sp. WWM596]|uniref:hypothetical protein n=1 Tax=Methanosarcina sp. WWM596 TaxID=1434103 RepID=UPI000615AF02|nr:hypothetical protein [Methanosarcina sp. WWM596]AKB19048.1 hypothetical protein MSWHS_2185 [Methanosarcina sp. WWM596]